MEYVSSLKDSILNAIEIIFIELLIIVGTIILVKLVRRGFDQFVIKSSAAMMVDPHQYRFIRHLLAGVVYFCGIGLAIYMIPAMHHLALSMFAGSGVLAVVIGFASQHSIANIVSGIFITIFKPFRVGDSIKLLTKEVSGSVEDITLRHTIIKTAENNRILIPNSVISTEILENASIIDEKACKIMDIGISYDSDMEKAIEIIREEAMTHPETIDNRDHKQKLDNEPIVPIRVVSLAESAVVLRIWIWAKNQSAAFKLGCDLNKNIKQRFDKEGIEISSPQRSVLVKNKPSV